MRSVVLLGHELSGRSPTDQSLSNRYGLLVKRAHCQARRCLAKPLHQSLTFPPRAPGVLGPQLADAYVRKLDIINRGLSGYNTRQALAILPQVIPSPQQARIRFLTIFFGANDARLPDTLPEPQQHVPLEEFMENMRVC